MLSPDRPALYLITNDQDLPNKRSLLQAVGIAVDAGIPLIQFRTKPGSSAPFPLFSERVAITKALKKICDAAHASLFINDELALAAACGTHLHLGQSDTALTQARQQLPSNQFIGVTCHDQIPLAQHAHEHGAHYVSFGAFFSSKTKPHARTAAPSILSDPRLPPLPKVAIGGITTDNAPQLFAAGADILAISHGILGAEDQQSACKQFLKVVEQKSTRILLSL
jgi:thiamine-phosphate pyrophosphorylase